jgi:hypothetical protein
LEIRAGIGAKKAASKLNGQRAFADPGRSHEEVGVAKPAALDGADQGKPLNVMALDL